MSQSLWVRDRFLINNEYSSPEFLPVAIPLGHGQVFNISAESIYQVAEVAIPLGQGQVFNESLGYAIGNNVTSQSLWVRDRFLINGE